MLVQLLTDINDTSLMADFLQDICTPKELKSLEERLQVAILLSSGAFTYREIHKKTGVSLVTITRVARFLKIEKNNGYQKVIAFMGEEK